MKKLMIIMLVFSTIQLAKAQEESVKTGPMMEFKEKLYNFGTIVQGDTVLHTFVFENVGTEPLKILAARGSCGCTVPKYSKEEIAPGAKGEVQVKFNSAGKMGNQNKTVTLTTNAADKKPIILTIRGTVAARTTDGED